MKATLKFDLDDPEKDDRIYLEDAINGFKWKNAMWELDRWLRTQYKYMPDEEYSEAAYKAYEKSREKLYEIINADGLKLN